MPYSKEDREIREEIFSLYQGNEIKEESADEKLQKNIQTISDITNKKLGGKIKKRMEGNIKGALLGGAFGVVIGIANRQSPIMYGIIGLIVGRIIFNNKLSNE